LGRLSLKIVGVTVGQAARVWAASSMATFWGNDNSNTTQQQHKTAATAAILPVAKRLLTGSATAPANAANTPTPKTYWQKIKKICRP